MFLLQPRPERLQSDGPELIIIANIFFLCFSWNSTNIYVLMLDIHTTARLLFFKALHVFRSPAWFRASSSQACHFARRRDLSEQQLCLIRHDFWVWQMAGAMLVPAYTVFTNHVSINCFMAPTLICCWNRRNTGQVKVLMSKVVVTYTRVLQTECEREFTSQAFLDARRGDLAEQQLSFLIRRGFRAQGRWQECPVCSAPCWWSTRIWCHRLWFTHTITIPLPCYLTAQVTHLYCWLFAPQDVCKFRPVTR